MKTMMNLLIRLQQLKVCTARTTQNQQLSPHEKDSLVAFKQLVRDCLPKCVQTEYDLLQQTEPELLACPDIFAMAVLVSAWRKLSPQGRLNLQNHFSNPPPARSVPPGGRRNGRRPRALLQRGIQPPVHSRNKSKSA